MRTGAEEGEEGVVKQRFARLASAADAAAMTAREASATAAADAAARDAKVY